MDITKAEAIRAYGTHQALADALGIKRNAVTMWKDGPIPEVHALRLRYELRPEIFGADAGSPPARRKRKVA